MVVYCCSLSGMFVLYCFMGVEGRTLVVGERLSIVSCCCCLFVVCYCPLCVYCIFVVGVCMPGIGYCLLIVVVCCLLWDVG